MEKLVALEELWSVGQQEIGSWFLLPVNTNAKISLGMKETGVDENQEFFNTKQAHLFRYAGMEDGYAIFIGEVIPQKLKLYGKQGYERNQTAMNKIARTLLASEENGIYVTAATTKDFFTFPENLKDEYCLLATDVNEKKLKDLKVPYSYKGILSYSLLEITESTKTIMFEASGSIVPKLYVSLDEERVRILADDETENSRQHPYKFDLVDMDSQKNTVSKAMFKQVLSRLEEQLNTLKEVESEMEIELDVVKQSIKKVW